MWKLAEEEEEEEKAVYSSELTLFFLPAGIDVE